MTEWYAVETKYSAITLTENTVVPINEFFSDTFKKKFPERFINGHIRKHLLWYLKGFVGSASIKAEVSTEPDLDKVLLRIKTFMEEQK